MAHYNRLSDIDCVICFWVLSDLTSKLLLIPSPGPVTPPPPMREETETEITDRHWSSEVICENLTLNKTLIDLMLEGRRKVLSN